VAPSGASTRLAEPAPSDSELPCGAICARKSVAVSDRVYWPVVTGLSARPLAVAMALRLAVWVSATAPVYRVPCELLGVEPSVV
jgi:hypothetical protein